MKCYFKLRNSIPVPAIFLLQENDWTYAAASRPIHYFKEGDVIEVPFPYSDLSGFKTRPALVLALSKMDLTIAFFSTHHSWAAFEDILFLADDQNGLHSTSLLRISKIFSIHPGMVFRKLGKIEEDEMGAVRWSLQSYFSGKKWPE
jgi:mRNA interferase MazF